MSIVSDLPLEAFELYQGEELIMHLGIGLTLYFPRPFKAVGPGIHALWKDYLSVVPPQTFTWARLGGGNRIRKRVYKTRDLARADVFDYIEVFYNRTRRHSHLGGLSPEAFERAAA